MTSSSGAKETFKSAGFRAPRAMLARVADASYWMSRYIERAEHIARVLLVSSDVLIGAGDMDEHFARETACDVLRITLRDHMFAELAPPERTPGQIMSAVAHYMTLDADNPNSLINCLSKARENARSIRESISAEMWEHLNTFYWSLKAEDAITRFNDSPQEFLRAVISGSLLMQGLVDQTMDHGQVWLFVQLSKYLERVDMTCRILSAKIRTLTRFDSTLDASLLVIQWMAVLRACCCIEAYRRVNLGDLEPSRIAGFIVFEPTFPRSVHFCVSHALESVERIRTLLIADTGREVQRNLGRLFADLQYNQTAPSSSEELLTFLEEIRVANALAATAMQEQWFLHTNDRGGKTV
jgi:uncharacterized alpha-E superfamily protein